MNDEDTRPNIPSSEALFFDIATMLRDHGMEISTWRLDIHKFKESTTMNFRFGATCQHGLSALNHEREETLQTVFQNALEQTKKT